jgi:hypothetical protein
MLQQCFAAVKFLPLLQPAGASKALYGFEPTEVVGQPLAAVVDVFGLWRWQFTEDQSLLCLLASQAAADMSAGTEAEVAGLLTAAAGGSGGSCWRVGVHLPMTSDELIARNAAQLVEENSRAAKVSRCTSTFDDAGKAALFVTATAMLTS